MLLVELLEHGLDLLLVVLVGLPKHSMHGQIINIFMFVIVFMRT